MQQGRRRVARTRIGPLALGAAVLSLASACTSGTSSDPRPATSPSSSASTSVSPSDAPVTLRVVVYGGAAQVDAYRALAKAYEKTAPTVTIKLQDAGDETAAQATLDRQFAAGTAPDVFLADSTALPSLVSGKRVQRVDQLLEKRDVEFGASYERLGLEAFSADSALQCMPTDVSPYVVYYNLRLFEKTPLAIAALPRTPARGWRWSVFTEAARQMSSVTAAPATKGVYLSPELTTLTPLLRSAGTDVVDDPAEPTTLQLSDDSARSALEKILAVARDPQISPTESELATRGALQRFEKGQLGMIIGTRALVPELRDQPRLRFDVAPMPVLGTFSTIADVDGLCISSGSQHVDAAADFLAYASGDTGSELLAQSGGIMPANLDTVHSPSFDQPGRFPISASVYSRVMRRATMMPNPPAWPEVVATTEPLLRRLFYRPAPDLDYLLPRIDRESEALLSPPTPSPSPSSSGSAAASPSS